MLTINLNAQVKTLDGNDVPDSSIAKLVANQLVSGSEGPFLKLFEIAQSLWKTGIMQVDQTDFDLVKTEVSNSKGLTVLAKAQILMLMDEQKALHKE